MDKIQEIIRRINANDEIGGIQIDIANLLAEQLELKGDNLSYWEKQHFAHAIAALGLNMAARHQPSTAWLRLCLVDLETALIPQEQRSQNIARRDDRLDSLTYEQLRREIQALGGYARGSL